MFHAGKGVDVGEPPLCQLAVGERSPDPTVPRYARDLPPHSLPVKSPLLSSWINYINIKTSNKIFKNTKKTRKIKSISPSLSLSLLFPRFHHTHTHTLSLNINIYTYIFFFAKKYIYIFIV